MALSVHLLVTAQYKRGLYAGHEMECSGFAHDWFMIELKLIPLVLAVLTKPLLVWLN